MSHERHFCCLHRKSSNLCSSICHKQKTALFRLLFAIAGSPDLLLTPSIRYPEVVNLHSLGIDQVNGKYSLFVEAGPNCRTSHRYQPSS